MTEFCEGFHQTQTYPYFGVDFISSLQMLRDVILLLGNRVELLASVNVNSAD